MKDKKKKDARKRSVYLFHRLHNCPKCGVYEVYRVNAGEERAYYKTDHYPDFPKLGHPAKICPDCGGWKHLTNPTIPLHKKQ